MGMLTKNIMRDVDMHITRMITTLPKKIISRKPKFTVENNYHESQYMVDIVVIILFNKFLFFIFNLCSSFTALSS